MPPQETSGCSVITANYNASQAQATFNYKRVVTPNRVVLGAELAFSPLKLGAPEFAAGAEFKLQRSKVSLACTGEGRISSLVEAKLGRAPGSPTLTFAADMNPLTDDMRFGYGINIEG
jgi:hypothetical protein